MYVYMFHICMQKYPIYIYIYIYICICPVGWEGGDSQVPTILKHLAKLLIIMIIMIIIVIDIDS